MRAIMKYGISGALGGGVSIHGVAVTLITDLSPLASSDDDETGS